MNRLAASSSPYLRQHADNPVAWWPWCDEAFAEARARDVPVLVSIGYSTCHWCHVMAHESFEDADTAAAMNRDYICIKVDREEHPEVDEIYMDAVQALTGHGGWPLNAMTDHNGRPFYALTYLPRDRWQGLCAELARLWRDDRPRLVKAATDITAHLALDPPPAGVMPAGIWNTLGQAARSSFDPADPGFAYGASKAPKFPASQLIPLLLDLDQSDMRSMALATLEAMQDSGLHDRVGGGFHRYSVTQDWRLPHFEKMLYDNAQLMAAYARAGRLADRPDFLRSAVNIGDYLLRDMRVESAGQFLGYAAAEDADDPGGEGSFYAWSPADVISVLGEKDGARVVADWALAPGEREIGPHGHEDPVLTHIPQPRAAGISGADPATQQRRAAWEPFLLRLRAKRNQRPRPGRDDKVLTDLNALALEGFCALARFAEPTDQPRFRAAAEELLTILQARHSVDGLQRSPERPAFITDYGHLVSALTAAFSLLGDPTLITAAIAVVDEASARLRGDDGGFWTTPAGRRDLIRRSRESTDNASPAGQNTLAVGCMRLWSITGDDRFRDIADGIFSSSAFHAGRAPTACCTLLAAWRLRQLGQRSVVITGPQPESLLTTARTWPGADIAIIPAQSCAHTGWTTVSDRTGLTTSQALVCVGTHCLAPAITEAELATRLREMTG